MLLALALLAAPRKRGQLANAPKRAKKGTLPPVTARDREALARMLASESRHPDVRVVLGYYAMEAARKRGIGVADRLTGKSGKFGPQFYLGEARYASTRQEATEDTRRMADQLLAGRLRPSRQILAGGLSAWVEAGVGGWDAKKLLGKQGGENGYGGIWGRIEGTRWYLYQRKAPLVPYEPGQEEQALAAIPTVPAVDRVAVAMANDAGDAGAVMPAATAGCGCICGGVYYPPGVDPPLTNCVLQPDVAAAAAYVQAEAAPPPGAAVRPAPPPDAGQPPPVPVAPVLRQVHREPGGDPIRELIEWGIEEEAKANSPRRTKKAPRLPRWPVPRKKITRVGQSVMADRRADPGEQPHHGLDIYVPSGTQVRTPAAGTVLRVIDGRDSDKETRRAAGLWVDLAGRDGLLYRFLHLGSAQVKAGQQLKAGAVIGRVALPYTSGLGASGPHLHFEMRQDPDQTYGAPVDPLARLPKRRVDPLARKRRAA